MVDNILQLKEKLKVLEKQRDIWVEKNKEVERELERMRETIKEIERIVEDIKN